MIRRSFLLGLLALAGPLPALAEGKLRSITTEDAYAKVSAGQMVLIDVRTPREWAETGVPSGAARIEMDDTDFLKKLQALKQQNPGKEIGLICRTGNRSSVVQSVLARLGHDDVIDVRGGLAGSSRDKGWLQAKLPVEK